MAKVTEKIFLIKTQYDGLVFKPASAKGYVVNQDTGEYGIFIGNPRIRFSDFINRERINSKNFSRYSNHADGLFKYINQNKWIVIRQAEKDVIDRVKREQGFL